MDLKYQGSRLLRTISTPAIFNSSAVAAFRALSVLLAIASPRWLCRHGAGWIESLLRHLSAAWRHHFAVYYKSPDVGSFDSRIDSCMRMLFKTVKKPSRTDCAAPSWFRQNNTTHCGAFQKLDNHGHAPTMAYQVVDVLCTAGKSVLPHAPITVQRAIICILRSLLQRSA